MCLLAGWAKYLAMLCRKLRTFVTGNHTRVSQKKKKVSIQEYIGVLHTLIYPFLLHIQALMLSFKKKRPWCCDHTFDNFLVASVSIRFIKVTTSCTLNASLSIAKSTLLASKPKNWLTNELTIYSVVFSFLICYFNNKPLDETTSSKVPAWNHLHKITFQNQLLPWYFCAFAKLWVLSEIVQSPTFLLHIPIRGTDMYLEGLIMGYQLVSQNFEHTRIGMCTLLVRRIMHCLHVLLAGVFLMSI